ncbi:hypothetical protein SUDANB58_04519 [Streptomyces sp. enrichment culture]
MPAASSVPPVPWPLLRRNVLGTISGVNRATAEATALQQGRGVYPVARPVVSGSRRMRVGEWRKAVPPLTSGCGKRFVNRLSKGSTACGPRSRTVRWNARREPREGVGQVAVEGMALSRPVR